MDGLLLLRFFSAFAFVISLMLLLSWAMKRFSLSSRVMAGAAKRRLKIVEFMQLDARRRLVLVRCDDREHLLLLGSQSETVVRADMPAGEENIVAFSRGQKNAQS